MEASLLKAFDSVVKQRGSTRSEVLRDLARAEVTRAEVAGGADAVAALTLVYDHHVRDLTERLIELQHSLGDRVRSAMHVHLDQDHCLEVIVMQGRSDELRAFAEKVFATRGVKHGGIEVIATTKPKTEKEKGRLHVHLHSHGGEHDHDHDHDHDHEPAKKRKT
jgi:CopG family nickel-responsive transcriptional regulator